MKRLCLLAAVLAACQKAVGPPIIDSFSVDNANPDVGAVVTFSYAVRNATSVRIDPGPGVVTGSPVSVVPAVSGTYTLRARNQSAVEVTSSLGLTLRPVLAIDVADATPGQVQPGMDVNLTWSTTSAERVTLADGSTGQVSDVAASGSLIVHPAATTIYTLVAYNQAGRQPASLTAKMAARVGVPPSISDFAVDKPSIVQGQFATLSWHGNAVSYSVSDGTTTFNLGPRLSLVVRPAATTTYTLQAAGLGGTSTAGPVTVSVTAQSATKLVYTAPPAAPLQLVADPGCTDPCTDLTLHIQASADVQLRGLAIDLPLDTTKVSFTGFVPASPLSGAVSQAAMGSGPLQDTLVIGVALKGTGTAVAQDAALHSGDEVGSFTLRLLPAGGVGNVFDGTAPPVGYKAIVQGAAGRGTVAIGKLDAN